MSVTLVLFVLHQDFPTVLGSEHGAWLCFMGCVEKTPCRAVVYH